MSYTYSLYKTEWYHNTYWRQIHIPSCPTPIVYIKQNGIITLTGEQNSHTPSCPTPIVYIKQNGIITLTGDIFTYRVSYTYSLYKTEWYHNTYWRQIHIPSCPTPIVYIKQYGIITYWRQIHIPLCPTPIVYRKQNGIITLTGDIFTYRRVLHL